MTRGGRGKVIAAMVAAALAAGCSDDGLTDVEREAYGQYVLTGGTVYALPARYGAMIPTNVDQLIAKQLIAPKERLARLEPRQLRDDRDLVVLGGRTRG